MFKSRHLLAVLICTALLAGSLVAQDAREALGPKDNPKAKKSPHPLTALMASLHSQLRPELKGVHPRVFVTDAELVKLRERAKTTHKPLWQPVLENVRALKKAPPAPPAEERRAQNEVGIAIAEAALAYKIDGDPKYLAAAKQYMDAAVSYEIWGYRTNKPNVDLAAGHLLYGLGMGYDLLYNDLSAAERAKYRDKLAVQAKLLADHYKPKPGRTFSYSQNHVFIPMSGLAVAAYAIYDEVPEAPQWAAQARAFYDRILSTYSPDGYYYEGFEYWVFSTPWILHYLDAHAHATGEDLYDRPGLREMYNYAANVLLPGGQDMFDFGDVFEGPITRAKQGDEYWRSHPGGRLHSNYNMLYRLAARFQDSKTQGVAEWMKSQNHVNAEDFWSLIWYDDKIKPTAIESIPTYHYFKDHEVVFWRTDWTANATAIAFKSGPPEGHHTAEQLKKFPDWHLSAGHSHPDANSFIVFAKGKYLTGDSGYAGVPKTEHHNTLLVDGRGQGFEGKGHDPWDGMDYERLNNVRIVDVTATPTSLKIFADAAGAYEPELKLERFRRTLSFDGKRLTIKDNVAAGAPRTFTILLHADDKIATIDGGYLIGDGNGALKIAIDNPKLNKAEVQENFVTAPGRPGAVDKGEVQKRGQRLALSTAEPAREASFGLTLQVQ